MVCFFAVIRLSSGFCCLCVLLRCFSDVDVVVVGVVVVVCVVVVVVIIAIVANVILVANVAVAVSTAVTIFVVAVLRV